MKIPGQISVKINNAGEKLERCSRDAAPGLFGPRTEIDAKPAAFPDRRALWRWFAIQQYRKGLAEHRGAGRRQEPHAPLNAAVVFLQKIRRPAGIEFVDFHVAADLHVPAETLLENAVAEPVHFGEVGKERTVTIGSDELDHVRLLAGLVLRDWRRWAGEAASCVVAQGVEDGTYSMAALEAANLATAWQIVLTPNFIFALSR